jgi:hypothetical protein
MKYITTLVIILALAGIVHAEDYDMCNNIDGMQTTMPSGYSTIGANPPGSCYVIPPPVTIDVNPVGSGVDAVTIDVNPAGSGVDAVQIDVNPTPSSSGNTTSTTNAQSQNAQTTSSTIKVITSTEELQTYLFDPKVPVAERAMIIEERIKAAMIQLIEMLTKQLNELIAAQR